MIGKAGDALRAEVLATVSFRDRDLPITACYLGSEREDAPVLAIVGGVHGVERIGSQVVLAFLETLVQRLRWDQSLINSLQHMRMLFIPIVNPAGLISRSRANASGVDLMRNAPIDAQAKVPFLAGGHRISSLLPWYRGKRNMPMEVESQALCDAISRELSRSPFTLSLDVHSGYGVQDRLWFPLACSHEPVDSLPEIYGLFRLLQKTYPNLNYIIEPQSHSYLTHGDLWDYLYLQQRTENRLFLPITLEMGSWNWVKKNLRQTWSFDGWFNPVMPWRVQRVLRRHTILLEFLMRATQSYQEWLPILERREKYLKKATKIWYRKKSHDKTR